MVFQRKYVRDADSVPATNFYGAFRDWYTDNFLSLNANDWTDLILEDERFNYTLYGKGRVVEEVVVLDDGEVSLPPEDTDEQ